MESSKKTDDFFPRNAHLGMDVDENGACVTGMQNSNRRMQGGGEKFET
jgi:hypothetical protein